MGAVDITNPQTWNRYAYAGNNPLSNTDPLGLIWCGLNGDDENDSDCDVCGVGFLCFYFPPGFGGGGGGGGGQPPSQPPAQPPINFPNETLGLPNGFPTSPWGVWGAIIPSADCGDITCVPIGEGAFATVALNGVSSFNIPGPLLFQVGVIWWALNGQHTPVGGFTGFWSYLMGAYNWCGPGGSGLPVDQTDYNCLVHDYCYFKNGFTPGSNRNPGLSAAQSTALQACNQQLCNSENQVGGFAAWQISQIFKFFPTPANACH